MSNNIPSTPPSSPNYMIPEAPKKKIIDLKQDNIQPKKLFVNDIDTTRLNTRFSYDIKHMASNIGRRDRFNPKVVKILENCKNLTEYVYQ